MMRWAVALLVALGALVSAGPAWAVDVTVTVGPGTTFTPADTTIHVGDRVVWNWDSTNVAKHTVTSGTPGSPDGVFDSGPYPPGQATGSYPHTFNSAGVFNYYCRVHGSFGMTGKITVVSGPPPADTPPTARFTASPASPSVGQVVTFNASASSDTDTDTISSYMWSFDGSPPVTTTSATATHKFTTPGTHNVTLTVLDSRGSTSAAVTHQLNVSAVPVQPKITKASVKPKAFCTKKAIMCKHPGAKLRFKLDMKAKVTLVVMKKGETKVLRRRTLDGKAGKNSFAFGGKGLTPGKYLLTLTPSGGGVSSKPVKVRFRIKKS